MADVIEVNALIGQKIKEVRRMTTEEMSNEGWASSGFWGNPIVIIVEDGTKVYPSRDDEGNGPGVLFGETNDGAHFYIQPHE